VEWQHTKTGSNEELAKLTFFSMKKTEPEGSVVFRITLREYAVPPAPLLPSGWGDSEWEALEGCLRLIRSFPYQGDDWN
jgi:hypothetical protein